MNVPTELAPERLYIAGTLAAYWAAGEKPVLALPLPRAEACAASARPPAVAMVELPEWAADLGVQGGLLAPSFCVLPGEGPAWSRTDWLGMAFWFVSGAAERGWESAHGPVHSYARRLRGFDPRLWERAWANRAALFLRRFAARQAGRDEVDLLGPLPRPELHLTHDVDAVAKTPAMRFKQGVFRLVAAANALRPAGPGPAAAMAARAGRMLVSRDDYWRFDQIRDLEERRGVRSSYLFHVRTGWRGIAAAGLDPGYRVAWPRVAGMIRDLAAAGYGVGLHQSYGSWADAGRMREERKGLEAVLGAPVSFCRQHWLRFSWDRTWKAQEQAGLGLDYSLGFNDRAGFRAGAALAFHPWDPVGRRPMGLAAVPTVLMDSHLHDGAPLSVAERLRRTLRILEEVRQVRGQAAVVWHQQAFAPDFGWGEDYTRLLEAMPELGLAAAPPWHSGVIPVSPERAATLAAARSPK